VHRTKFVAALLDSALPPDVRRGYAPP